MSWAANKNASNATKPETPSAPLCSTHKDTETARSAKKLFLLLVDLLSVFLISGVIFGWTSFRKVLVEEGFFSKDCPSGGELCASQEVALDGAFTAATTAMSLVALPAGWLLDAWGPFIGAAVASFFQIVGLICLAISDQFMDDALLSYSLVSIAIGGFICYTCAFSAPFLFPSRAVLVCALTSGLFDASGVVFPVLELLYGRGVSFQALVWSYMGACAFIFVLLMLAWTLNKDQLQPAHATSETPHSQSQVTCKQQLWRCELWFIVVYSLMQIPRATLYLGTVNLVTTEIATNTGEGDKLDTVMSIIWFIIPSMFGIAPLIEIVTNRLGPMGALHVTTLLGVAFNALQLIPSLNVQVLAAIIYAAFRAFLYGSVMAFNAYTFGPHSMGRIMGLCQGVAGLVNILQAPIVQFTVVTLKRNCLPMLLGSLAVSPPLSLLALFVKCGTSASSLSTLHQ